LRIAEEIDIKMTYKSLYLYFSFFIIQKKETMFCIFFYILFYLQLLLLVFVQIMYNKYIFP